MIPKFRAWHPKFKTMFKVGQITFEEGTWDYAPEDKEHIGLSIPSQPDFILMQYTGLKDKNGVEIYEGDIVECYSTGLSKVQFMYGCFGLCHNGRFENFIDIYGLMKVIGNVHEHPHLLEAQS